MQWRPIVATSDPLQEAFFATFGRLLPLDGRVGVALLLTLVIEIMSCFGLAALRTLGEPRGRLSRDGALILPVDVGDDVIETHEHSSPVTNKLVPEGAENIPSNSSLTAASLGSLTRGKGGTCRESNPRTFSRCARRRRRQGVTREHLFGRAIFLKSITNMAPTSGSDPSRRSSADFVFRWTEFWQPSSMLELG